MRIPCGLACYHLASKRKRDNTWEFPFLQVAVYQVEVNASTSAPLHALTVMSDSSKIGETVYKKIE